MGEIYQTGFLIYYGFSQPLETEIYDKILQFEQLELSFFFSKFLRFLCKYIFKNFFASFAKNEKCKDLSTILNMQYVFIYNITQINDPIKLVYMWLLIWCNISLQSIMLSLYSWWLPTIHISVIIIIGMIFDHLQPR